MPYLEQDTHLGPPGLKPQVIFCTVLCTVENINIHVSVKNPSTEDTCVSINKQD